MTLKVYRQKATFETKFRRRRERKTNYAKRLALVKSGKPKLVVRKTNKYVYLQAVSFERNGDKVIAQANSKELEKLGWKGAKRNTPAAYLTGLLFGARVRKKNVVECVLDIGFNSPVHGGVCFAALKGALDSGIKIPFDASALPKEERIFGLHISKDLKGSVEKTIEEIKRQAK